MPRVSTSDKASIHAVAAAAGVSVMSVSRAIRGVEGVSEATRQRILQVARELNYTPNNNAQALATTGSNLIGISLPTLFNDVFADILLGMRRTFELAGYSIVMDTSDYSLDAEYQFVSRLLSWRPVGLILTGTTHLPEVRETLASSAVRTVETWDFTDTPIDLCVGIDHYKAGFDLGAHLVDLGYRSPAFVGAPPGYDPRADKRVNGLTCAFRAVGARELRRFIVSETNAFVAGAKGYRMIDPADHPDVVIFLADHFAFGGMMAAQEAGFSVPGDFGIAGFNLLDINQVLPSKLTTMATPRRQIGLIAGRNLIAALKGAEVDAAVRLPCDLVPGQTTRMQ